MYLFNSEQFENADLHTCDYYGWYTFIGKVKKAYVQILQEYVSFVCSYMTILR